MSEVTVEGTAGRQGDENRTEMEHSLVRKLNMLASPTLRHAGKLTMLVMLLLNNNYIQSIFEN